MCIPHSQRAQARDALKQHCSDQFITLLQNGCPRTLDALSFGDFACFLETLVIVRITAWTRCASLGLVNHQYVLLLVDAAVSVPHVSNDELLVLAA
jgi:hypothetical protein